MTIKDIDVCGIEFNDISKLCKELENNKHYHFRIIKGNQYIFFGDLDNYKQEINVFIQMLQDFMKNRYNLEFVTDEFKYTKNSNKEGSYHYSISKWHATTNKLKEIHQNFIKEHKDDLTHKTDKKTITVVDTTIYSNHWFRCPKQSKGKGENGIHKIINGEMKDFIISHIPENSENIENVDINEIKNQNTEKVKLSLVKKEENELIEIPESVEISNVKQLVLTRTLGEPELYMKLFDECYNKDRFDNYDSWIRVGMAINNIFSDGKIAFDLFDYFSAKGGNYEGTEKTYTKFKSFVKKHKSNGHTVATIYYYALEDNKPKFVEIMTRNTLELGQTDICKYVKILAGNKFVYQKQGSNYKLFCYDNGRWLDDDSLLKKFISEELYQLLKMILTEVFWNSTNNRDFLTMKQQLDNLKKARYKKDVIETYKEYGANEDIHFDDKWWLLGFNNKVYDFKERSMRKYEYDDYIVTTTGYDWRTNRRRNQNNRRID